MKFFSDLFGFQESSYNTTKKALLSVASFRAAPPLGGASYARELCDFNLPDGKTFSAGFFSMPSVGELREQVSSLAPRQQQQQQQQVVAIQNTVGESRSLHSDASLVASCGAVVQAASQFNLLEFPSASNTPEAGISGYVHDHTQGPACAIACAAGTAYRNYLVPMPFSTDTDLSSADLKRGQTKQHQLNGLADIEAYLVDEYNLEQIPWWVKNGYIESTAEGIGTLNSLLSSVPSLHDQLISLIRIGVQEDTTVTDVKALDRTMTQTYNSAVSIGYSRLPDHLWEPLARLVLEATYEATLLVGVLKALQAQSKGLPVPPILLTKVGGGVFRNKKEWIIDAISRAMDRVEVYNVDLDIRLVHFRAVEPGYDILEQRCSY